MSGVDTADRIILGMVPDRLADDVVRQSGVDIRGFKNVLHSDGLRHGAKHDVNTGNIPLTPDDVVGALDIFENYDKVTVTEKRGESSIKLQRTEPDGITYIAVIGKKKGHVFTKNIWKMVTTKDGSSRRTDATIAPASTPEAAANIKPSFDDSVTFAKTEYNGDQKSSQFNFSENAPTKRQSSLDEAWELFDNNSTPEAYYESNPRGFDLQTSNLLRGLMLRNGENVGGTLSDARMERIAGIFAGANRRNALSLSLSSPVRVFEDVTGWGGRTAEERAKNVRNGNLLKNTYYEYGNLQAANRETWIAENMRPVIEATTKQNPVNSCPDGRGAAGAARRIRLRRKGLFRLLCRRCRYAPCPPDMEEYEVPAGPGRCLNVRGPYRKPCRTCSAAP